MGAYSGSVIETFAELCEISKKKLFAKIVNGFCHSDVITKSIEFSFDNSFLEYESSLTQITYVNIYNHYIYYPLISTRMFAYQGEEMLVFRKILRTY